MKLRNPLVAGLAVVALMLTSHAAFAQDAAVPATDPAAPAAVVAPDAAAPDAAAAVAGPAVDPWLKVCDTLADGKKACIMQQMVQINGQPLASFTLRDDPGQQSRLLAVANLPLGVLLPFGLTWQIDAGKPLRVPFILCDAGGCSSQLVINEEYINSLKKGATLKLSTKNRFNQDLTIQITLAGFTAMYDGPEDMSMQQYQDQATGQDALEKTLQDHAEAMRRQLAGGAAPAPTDGTAPAPAAP